MPISGPPWLQPISQDAFGSLDYQVMRLAFESQNQLGRLCDEEIYQRDLVARLQSAGLVADQEVPVRVSYRDFAKTYLLDLVVAQAGIYELKTAHGLAGTHEAQLLHYLFLCGAHHGKLINFRPPQVESRFVNAPSAQSERRQFTLEMETWEERDKTEQVFRECLFGLLNDWGGWLDVELYTEAPIHFSGGEGKVVQRLPLTRDTTRLGTQCFHLLNPETAFRVTALTQPNVHYQHQLLSLLRLSPLRTIHWVNLGRQKIQLVSLTR
jgi:GxxExxY protein